MGMTTAHQQQQELLPRLEQQQQQQQLQQQLQLPARHTTAARRLPSSFELFISAAVSGLITKTACAPMDRLRLLYQVQGMLQHTQQHQQQQQQQQQYGQHQRHRTALKQGNSPWRLSQGLPVNNKDFLPEGIAQVNNSYKYTKYKGIISGLRLVIQEEGFRGLWRGNGVNAVRAAACYAIKFPANDLAKRALTTSSSSNSSSSSSSSNSGSGSGSRANVGSLLLAGALAGSLQKTLSYPLDFLSVRIAVGINADRLGKHHVAGAAAAAAPSSSSISSCNSSCTSNGGANSPYTSKNSNVTGHNSSSGSISISNSSSSRSRKGYNGVVDCARRVWQLEGPLGFFKGYSVALLSGVPYVMLQMAFFDLSQRCLYTWTQTAILLRPFFIAFP